MGELRPVPHQRAAAIDSHTPDRVGRVLRNDRGGAAGRTTALYRRALAHSGGYNELRKTAAKLLYA